MSIKDPTARLDFAWDWSAWLADGETIDSQTVTVISGDVTIDGPATEDAGIVTVWVEGGTVGTTSRLTCHIVTSDDREDDRSRTITIRER